jgi:uridine kinase
MAIGSKKSKVLSQDNYYLGGDSNTNYDEPKALDFVNLVKDIKKLRNGESIYIPQYDFTKHARKKSKQFFEVAEVIIVEGILLYTYFDLVELLDIKVYIESNEITCMKRRIKRDVVERGRKKEQVINRYKRDVIPSNETFVIPSKKHAVGKNGYILKDKCDFTFEGMDKLLSEINKRIGFNLMN